MTSTLKSSNTLTPFLLSSVTEIVLLGVDIRAEPTVWQWRGERGARQLRQKQSLKGMLAC